MMRLALALSIVLSCTSAFGQEVPSGSPDLIPRHCRSFMDQLVGNWTYTGTVGGQPIRGKWNVKWTPGKQSLVYGEGGSVGKKGKETEVYAGSGIAFYDPSTKEFVEVMHYSDGVQVTNRHPVAAKIKEGAPISGTHTRVEADSKKSVGTIRWELKGPDRQMYSVSGIEKAIKLDFRRSNPAKSAKARPKRSQSDFEAYCQAMEGRWINGNETLATDWFPFAGEGEKAVAHGEIRVVADGKALEGVWYGGTGTAKWLTTWDPVSKQIVKFCVVSDGTLWRETRTRAGDNKWLCDLTLSRPDGTKERIRSVLTVSDNGNTHTFTDAKDKSIEPGVYKRAGK